MIKNGSNDYGRERDVQGDILWSGGPGPFTEAAKGGQSYFCY
jgi:hypothetical protein